MSLNYSASNGSFSNSTGIDISVNDFGGTAGIEYLDPTMKDETVYYGTLVNSFVQAGYTIGTTLFGAPYDWRLAPLYSAKFFADLQNMIEHAYQMNQMKVSIVCHSLGNLFFLSFLRTMTRDWKEKHILTYYATAAPLVGAFTAAQSITSGYDFHIPYLNPADAKIIQRTFLSTYYLLPYPKFYQSKVLISVPGKNYTALDYPDLFAALNVSSMYEPYTLSFNTANPYEPPGVNTYCLHGYNVSTAVGETYTTTTFDKPTILYGNGDGTVPIESLTFCESWLNQTDNLLIVKGYEGQNHVGLLSYAPFIQDILSSLFNASQSL